MRSLIIVPVNNRKALTRYFCTVAPDVAVNNRTYKVPYIFVPF